MPWVLSLSDSTTTLNLLDGTTYFLNVGGFHAPPPPRRLSLSGGNLFRHGQDLLARTYDNRRVTVGLQIRGTNATALGTAVNDVWNLLRRAEEWSKEGLGTQVQLLYGWNNAAGTVAFNIIEGVLDLGADLHGPPLLQNTRVRNAQLELLCEPFAVGTAETVSNHLSDPSFEIAGSALADWTVSVGTGTVVRVTNQSKYGTASAEVRRTAGTADNQLQQVVTTGFTASDNVVAFVWVRPQALASGMSGRLWVEFLNSGGTVLTGSFITDISTAGTTWVQATGSGTVPTDAGTGTVRLSLQLRGGTGTGTVQFDGAYLNFKTSAVPAAFISGRAVRNHFDDNGQAHINYLDVYDALGDVLAPAQVKATEREAHVNFWLGARHTDRADDPNVFIEAENFSTGSGIGSWAPVPNSILSNGSGLSSSLTGQMSTSASAPKVAVWNIATPPPGLYRVLVRLNKVQTATGYIGVGYSYGSVIQTPSATSHYLNIGTGTEITIRDVGALTIPPIDTPVGGTVGTFGVRLAVYAGATNNDMTLDYIQLMPVDQGFVFGSKASAADALWADSRSQPQGLYNMTTGDVVNAFVGSQVGQPPMVHPRGTRFYFLGGSATGSVSDGWNATLTYLPRFLYVRGT